MQALDSSECAVPLTLPPLALCNEKKTQDIPHMVKKKSETRQTSSECALLIMNDGME